MDKVCENFNSDESMMKLNIGYSISSRPVFILIPSLSVLANISVILTYYLKKSKGNQTHVSMEKMLHILTIVETFISFYWLTSGIFLYSAEEEYKKCYLCFGISLTAIFLHMLDAVLVIFTIHNLQKIITDPVEGIMKHKKRLKMYLCFALSIAFGAMVISYMANVFGRSPMMTCFIRTEFSTLGQNINILFFLLFPFGLFIYSIYLLISLSINRTVLKDHRIKMMFYKYIGYICVYFIFNTPVLVLYAVSLKWKIEPNTFLSWFSYFGSVMTCSIPLVTTIIRVLQGYVKINFFKRRYGKLKTANERLLNDGGVHQKIKRDMTTNEFAWVERKIMEEVFNFYLFQFMRDIFIGICHSLYNSKLKYNFVTYDEQISKEDCLDLNEMTIIKEQIRFVDNLVSNSDAFEINFVEYAPKIFSNLRKLEHLSEEDMIKSFLPMKNQQEISESQGKSGDFFISTSDNKYILKTINEEELLLIRGAMLEKLNLHFNRYNNSLICRIYGLFKMVLPNGKDINVIMMRNVIGNFKQNILCKFDLKGSSLNRKTDFMCDNINHVVMKDNNFDEIEQFLVLPSSEVERLRHYAMTDSYFFNDLNVMDYSLFVVKLSLSSQEIERIFKDKAEHVINMDTSLDSVSVSEDDGMSAVYGIEYEKEIEPYRKYLYRSTSRNNVYIIAIIDYLQQYNFYKFIETNYKYYLQSRPSKVEAISCVPPGVYSSRFIEYVKKITDYTQILNKPLEFN